MLGTKARDVACPACGAVPGLPCEPLATSSGMVVAVTHQARTKAAVKLTRDANLAAKAPDRSGP